MDTAIQIAMGLSIAACAGMRAFLPLLVVGLLSHLGYLHLNPAFDFLGRTDALVVFGVATVVEILADKVIALDHLLDSISTVIRPVAGTVLAGSLLNHLDPLPAAALGLIVGGGPSLTVHAAKTVARYKSSVLTPFHGGLGNTALSVAEDLVSTFGIWFAVVAPIAAAALGVLLLVVAVLVLKRFAGVVRRAFKTEARNM